MDITLTATMEYALLHAVVEVEKEVVRELGVLELLVGEVGLEVLELVVAELKGELEVLELVVVSLLFALEVTTLIVIMEYVL